MATASRDRTTSQWAAAKAVSRAERAISSLNGKDLKGRALTVNEAKPRTDRPRSGGFGGGSGRSGGFGSGGGGGRRY